MKNNLPSNQLSESQRSPVKPAIKPNTKVMQTNLGGQTSLKAPQSVRAFAGQTKGIEQFVIDRFDQLTQTRQPVSPLFRPLAPTRLMNSAVGSLYPYICESSMAALDFVDEN